MANIDAKTAVAGILDALNIDHSKWYMGLHPAKAAVVKVFAALCQKKGLPLELSPKTLGSFLGDLHERKMGVASVTKGWAVIQLLVEGAGLIIPPGIWEVYDMVVVEAKHC